MILQIFEKIDVIAVYKDSFMPFRIRWKGRVYHINKLGYHHTTRVGNVIHHIFSVATENLAFRLNFDTENLSWILEEVSDGFAD
jgi:hypothetical protein